MEECKQALAAGVNVSFVVNGPQPKSFAGVPVFSMDETDLRSFDDEKGQFGFLKFKQTLTEIKDTNFVINSNDPRLKY